MLLVTYCSFSQSVGIGTTSPDASAALEITANNKGLLIPRMNLASINAIPNPARGLLVYDSAANQLMVNIGTAAIPNWQAVTGNSGNAWSLNGNAGIDPLNQFIGTKDDRPLRFRVNNIKAGEVNHLLGNVFLGLGAGFSNITGSSNTAIGDSSLFANTSGEVNTAIGRQTLRFNTTGGVNTAIGNFSLYSNTIGNSNTASGVESLFSNTEGEHNTANGFQSLFLNTLGDNNTAMGFQSLRSNTIGSANVAIGVSTLLSNTIGNSNTATGNAALFSNTTGNENTATGFHALSNNISGTGNTANGSEALRSNITGINNTALGINALFSNTTGSSNTAVGIATLEDNAIGNNNAAVGRFALADNISGNFNVAIGTSALSRNTVANNNVGIGFNAGGSFIAGSFNTFIGSDARTDREGLTNVTAIGAGAVVNASNKVRIGNSDVTVIEGQVPFSTPSDGRFKFNVREDVKGLDFIMQLRPVTYQFDMKRFNGNNKSTDAANDIIFSSYNEATAIRRTGFIAQEVERAANTVGYNFSGIIKPKTTAEHYSLSYESFVVPLVKGMQEQQLMIEDLKKQNADLLKRTLALERK